MKRSEVLSFIAYILKEQAFNKPGISYREQAEQLLHGIEIEGMLPPTMLNPKFQGGHNIDIHPYYINEWEKE